MIPQSLDEYRFSWQESDNVQFDLQKVDHIWRVLKYGTKQHYKDYCRSSYKDSHLVCSFRGEPAIVGAFRAEEIPTVSRNFTNTDHATSKMVERDIHSGERDVGLDTAVVYDRLGHYKWKFMSREYDDRLFFVIDSRNETVITMWRD